LTKQANKANIETTKKESSVCHRKGKTRVTGWRKATCPLINRVERGAVEVAGTVKKPTSFAGGLFCFFLVTSHYQSWVVYLIR
jgi:hypothetical protein